MQKIAISSYCTAAYADLLQHHYMTEKTLRAIVRQAFGGPEQLMIEEVPTPAPSTGEILLRVRAFGINRAEQYFRTGAWGDVHAISGIECVGEVESDPSNQYRRGQKVLALMGGMGRSIPGSYAEFVCVSSRNVVAITSSLSWPALAALPESYGTAWACLMDNLQLKAAQTLLIRGATSALGQAAVNIARVAGANVFATVRNPDGIERVKAIGADCGLLESHDLSQDVRKLVPGGLDAVLDIVGTSTVLDSLRALKRGGRVCLAGFLGGSVPLEKLDPLAHLPSGRHLSFFGSAFAFGTPEYPLSDIPFQHIVDHATSGAYKAAPAHVFQFNEIQRAHRMMDDQAARGKMVVVTA